MLREQQIFFFSEDLNRNITTNKINNVAISHLNLMHILSCILSSLETVKILQIWQIIWCVKWHHEKKEDEEEEKKEEENNNRSVQDSKQCEVARGARYLLSVRAGMRSGCWILLGLGKEIKFYTLRSGIHKSIRQGVEWGRFRNKFRFRIQSSTFRWTYLRVVSRIQWEKIDRK